MNSMEHTNRRDPKPELIPGLCSVIIPVYNGQRYVLQALHSALGQTYRDIEVIIIDDSSCDSTFTLVRNEVPTDPRIRFFHNKQNRGVARTRNIGFSAARGEFVALLDGDDLWEPQKLERQIALLRETGAGLCCTSYAYIGPQDQELRQPYLVAEAPTFEILLNENTIGASTVVLRREWTDRFRMNENYAHEDYVYWLELFQNGCTACFLPEPLVKYRVVPGNRSEDKRVAAKNRWIVYRRYLKYGRMRSLRYFSKYAVRGMKKHFPRGQKPEEPSHESKDPT